MGDGGRRRHQEKLKFSFKEQKEFETIDSDIESLEKSISELDAEISTVTTDYTKLHELTEKRKSLELELESKTERWLYLNELAEQIEMQKG